MNLRSVTRGAINSVNPARPLIWQRSLPYTTDSAGKRTPQYAAPVTIWGDIQPMQYKDLLQVDGIAQNGTKRKVYFYQDVEMIVRSMNSGGDLLTDQAGQVWLVSQVLESFEPQWCSVAIVLQNGS